MKKESTGTEVPTQTAIANQGNTNRELLEKFSALDDKDLKSPDLECINFEEGTVNNLIAVGVQEYEFSDGNKDVAIFEDIDGNQKYNGNSVVVNSIKKIAHLPAPVRIVCTGTEKGKNGTYKTFSIKTI